MLRDGIKAGIWNERFCPEGVIDFQVYLFEKIKTVLRKQRRSEKKTAMDDEYTMITQVLNDNAKKL